MTPEQKAAYVTAMAACVIARVAAMQARNRLDFMKGDLPTYGQEAVEDLIREYGIGHNAVMDLFR